MESGGNIKGNAMRIQLIANPVAGRNAEAAITQAQRYFASQGVEVDLCLTRGRGDAEMYAAQGADRGYDRLVVAGGDGTVNEVVNGMTAGSPPLAVLPAGTTNVLALEAELPWRVDQACAVALHGIPTAIHLGLAGERRFVLMAGIGFDAAVVRDVDLSLKRRVAKGAYLISACLGWLRLRDTPLRIVDDRGVTHHGYGAIISNARSYGGKFTMTPEASLVADCLDVCLILRPGRMAQLMAGMALVSGRPLAYPWGEQLRGRVFVVSGDGVPVQIDGDSAGELPRTFAMNPFMIRLMIPNS